MNYDDGNWQLLGHEMIHNPKIFSQITRAQLIDDAMALAKVGRLNFIKALQMPLALLHQGALGELTAADYGMFERAMRAVADIHDCLRGSKLESDLLVSDEFLIPKGGKEQGSNWLFSRNTCGYWLPPNGRQWILQNEGSWRGLRSTWMSWPTELRSCCRIRQPSGHATPRWRSARTGQFR